MKFPHLMVALVLTGRKGDQLLCAERPILAESVDQVARDVLAAYGLLRFRLTAHGMPKGVFLTKVRLMARSKDRYCSGEINVGSLEQNDKPSVLKAAIEHIEREFPESPILERVKRAANKLLCR